MVWKNTAKRKARRQANPDAEDARRAAYKQYRCFKQAGEVGEWFKVPDHAHAGSGYVDVWSTRMFGFDLMMSLSDRWPNPKVSFRRLRQKGLPYTELGRYPSFSVALLYVPYEFSQRLMEIENAKPVLEDRREVACHAIHRLRTYRPLEEDPIHSPAP